MEQITMIGLDLAKHVFQLHGVDASGTVLLRKAVRRGQLLAFFSGLPPCAVAMEACPTAHHWARELATLGHEVRLMPPKYVKAYVKRNKNDAADAEAICEAAGRPSTVESAAFARVGEVARAAGGLDAAPGGGTCWSGTGRCCPAPSAVTWPSSASSRRKGPIA
jgi:transposase